MDHRGRREVHVLMDIYLVAGWRYWGREACKQPVSLTRLWSANGACARIRYNPQNAHPHRRVNLVLVWPASLSISIHPSVLLSRFDSLAVDDLFRMISPLQSGAMREDEHPAHRTPLDIIRNSTTIGPQSFIQFSNQPDLLFYRSAGKFFIFAPLLNYCTRSTSF